MQLSRQFTSQILSTDFLRSMPESVKVRARLQTESPYATLMIVY